jgi:hypothetical protein
MRTSNRPSGPPSPDGPGPVDRTRRPDGIDTATQFTPQAMAGNTLMDGAASQLGTNQPPPSYDMCGPDDPENEDEDE